MFEVVPIVLRRTGVVDEYRLLSYYVSPQKD